jgi:hypothetical protein
MPPKLTIGTAVSADRQLLTLSFTRGVGVRHMASYDLNAQEIDGLIAVLIRQRGIMLPPPPPAAGPQTQH